MRPQRVFLVGPMGAGKTSVGKRLAHALGLRFIDSDHAIEARTGAAIPLIFDIEGEAGFRRREEAVIDELTQLEDIVLATGGGAVLALETRARLRARGTVVYLQTSIQQQLERTRYDKNRPLLRTDNPQARLQQLMQVRAPLYREVAHITVPTDAGNPRQVVRDIIRQLQARAATEPN